MKYNVAVLSRKLNIELNNCVNALLAQTIKPETIYILTIREATSGEETNKVFKENLTPNNSNIIIDYNSPHEIGFQRGVASSTDSATSMSRLRNHCIRFLNEDYNTKSNLLFLDSDVKMFSKTGVEEMLTLLEVGKIVSAPVRYTHREYEAMQKGQGAKLTVSDTSKGLILFQKYERGLSEEQVRGREYIEYDGCSGSCTMLRADVLNDDTVRFQMHPQGEWIGLWDANQNVLGKSIICPTVMTIHRSYWSH